MIRFELGQSRRAAAIAGVALLSACATKAPPPPPPPPPPPVAAVPIRPLPPGGATYVMAIPARGLDGRHMTVVENLNDDQKLWYFRSAWNVAALNCLGPEAQTVLDGYKKFLTGNAKALKATNARIDADFRKNYRTPGEAIKAREKLMTSVYNYFTLPPARTEFCAAAQQIALAQAAMPKPDAAALVAANFATFTQPFENFFTAYEQYQRDSAAWDAQYGARYGASQPGYVAVQAARASAVPQVGVSNPATLTLQPVAGAGVVTDQETGAQIPVVPVSPQVASVPVVQPVPQTTTKKP